MQERALRQLEGVHKKAKIEDEEAYKKNAYKLVHFHVEAFDGRIVENKMDLEDGVRGGTLGDLALLSDGDVGAKTNTISSKF